MKSTITYITINGKEYPARLHTVPPPDIDPQQVADFNAALRRAREWTATITVETGPTGPIVEGSIEPL